MTDITAQTAPRNAKQTVKRVVTQTESALVNQAG